MRWIYISPHFDDAVLSCGGLIAEQHRADIPTEIWTICAGDAPPGELSRFASRTHKDWGTGDAANTVHIRKEEDRQAAQIVGAKPRHFDFPDCIYRQGPNQAPLYTVSVFSPWNPLEKELPAQMAAAITSQLDADDVVVCPLAIGSHVDHVLTRMAVERLDRRLLYYADIPYFLTRPTSQRSVTACLHEELHPVTNLGFKAWIEGISAYRSQIAGLFRTSRRMHTAMAGYWQTCHALRLWRNW